MFQYRGVWMAEQLFADVLVEVPGVGFDRTFQYRVPQKLVQRIQFGHRVQVPFGGRRVTGFVVGFGEHEAVAGVKEIAGLVDEQPCFGADQLALAKWMAGYYFCDIVKALQTVIAPALKKTAARRVARYFCVAGPGELPGLRREMARRAPKSLAVLEAVITRPGMSRGELAVAAGASPSVIDRLVARGLLRVETEIPWRDPFPVPVEGDTERVRLTAEQERAVREIRTGLEAGRHQVFLLHGVTGSGKTEVYLHSIEHALRAGRQAITLVPEISLTPQMVRLYRARFGRNVAVLHSRMSDGERFDEWTRIERGEARVVLGARSAVLAPVPDPGLVVVDEEHEWSYKQEEAPRYHARAVALYRAQKHNGVLVLGSATPSLETFCRALPGGVYKRLSLDNRIDGRSMPAVRVVDMREEVRAGNGSIFSRVLLQKLRKKIHNNEQAIVFLNRRGLNTLVVCRECGLVLKCPRCEISLTYHIDGRLRCHYCNYTVVAPKLCPDCSSREVGYFGAGTQRVERELQEALPEARILRMDADTTTRKGSHQRILDAFAGGAADILVGTQMIAKGLDLPGVTLVGVVNADITLHMPDFRAGERTFQLLAQVAGRTGRGDRPGEVLIQTYTPEHYAVRAAAGHDYYAFYRHEIALRKSTGYPPFSKMVRLLVSGRDESAVQAAAQKIREQLDGFIDGFANAPDGGKIFIVGPAPAPLARLKEIYRWHLIAWSPDYQCLRRVMEQFWRASGGASPGKGLHLSIDVDPMSMM
ncbi:primosomal protein N' [Desulfallas sp. Bu1-1]|uniref:replication restart helicase PriA n=1 Tax=Desulfallas sp. Bu1-1 TaxID=2787620 RepID=UPI0028BE21FE|nr:primosomal protein N' [Desulfallas sp. Bu1-1]